MSAVSRLLRFWVWIPPEAWIFVCCECCVLSVSGLCDEVITRPEESYRLWCVVVCDQETSWMRRPWPFGGCRTKHEQKNYSLHEFIFTENETTLLCNLYVLKMIACQSKPVAVLREYVIWSYCRGVRLQLLCNTVQRRLVVNCWRFGTTYRLLCSVYWEVVTYVLGQTIGPPCRCDVSQRTLALIYRRFGTNYRAPWRWDG